MGATTALFDEIQAARGNLMCATGSMLTLSGNLFNSANVFVAVVEKIEKRFKELLEKETMLRDVEHKLIARIAEVDKREAMVDEREKHIKRKMDECDEREAVVDGKEAKWMETEKKMALNASKVPSIITLNVGGPRFAVSKAALTNYKGSYFDSLVHSNHYPVNSNNEIFIDREPELFKHVLDFLKTGRLRANLDFKTLSAVKREFTFFNLPFPSVTAPHIKTVEPPPPNLQVDLLCATIKKIFPQQALSPSLNPT